MYAAHHRLGHLTVMVDLNGQKALAKTPEVLSLSNIVERWLAFADHFERGEIDGASGEIEVADLGVVEGPNTGAAATVADEQPVGDERLHRGADRRPSDSELLDQRGVAQYLAAAAGAVEQLSAQRDGDRFDHRG